MAAVEEAVTIHRELAEARPDAVRPDLGELADQPVAPAVRPGSAGGGAGRGRGIRHGPPGISPRPGAFRPYLAQSLGQPVDPAGRPGTAGGGAGRGGRWASHHLPGAGRAARRVRLGLALSLNNQSAPAA